MTQGAGIPNDRRADLVFEGGGVKGIALAGAFRELSDRNYRPECVAGTSAGAINAALVAAGYSGAEVEDIVLRQMHFPRFADRTFLNRFGVGGGIVEFLRTRGMHSGDYFYNWIADLLKAKGIVTFGQLRNPNASSDKRAYRLQVIASDLTARRMLVLPRDAKRLGLDPDELEVAKAVRMSMSIPFYFEPVIVPAKDSPDHVIVDGGLLSNYPIWLFDTPGDVQPEFPTFGMLLVAPHQAAPLLAETPGSAVEAVDSNLDFLKAIEQTLTEAHDRFYVEQANFARTIPLPTLGVKTTEFDISADRSQQLFDAGKAAAASFLDAWDFDGYRARYRNGPPPGRTQTLAGA